MGQGGGQGQSACAVSPYPKAGVITGCLGDGGYASLGRRGLICSEKGLCQRAGHSIKLGEALNDLTWKASIKLGEPPG